MTDEQIAAECESCYQKGGPKLYTFDPESGRVLGCNYGSAAKALRMFAGTSLQVWQRRMTRRGGLRRYEFVRVYAQGDRSLPKVQGKSADLTYEQLRQFLALCDSLIHRNADHALHQKLAGSLRPVVEQAMIAKGPARG